MFTFYPFLYTIAKPLIIINNKFFRTIHLMAQHHKSSFFSSMTKKYTFYLDSLINCYLICSDIDKFSV